MLDFVQLFYTKPEGWRVGAEVLPDFEAWNSERTLAIIFGPPALLEDPAIIRPLRVRLSRAHFMGASSIGVISDASLCDDQLVVQLVRFHHTDLVQVQGTVNDISESGALGMQLAQQLSQKEKLLGVFVLADGLSVNGTALLQGMAEVLPDTPISGGMSGDGTNFARTSVFCDDDARARRVTAVGFYGERLVFSRGCQSGATGFGPQRRVTRSSGNEVFEVDGQPIIDVYKKYLGEQARSLPSAAALFPLSLRRNAIDDRPLIRSVLAVNEARNSITVAGDMPEGCFTQLMRTNHSQLLDGAQEAAMQAIGAVPGGARMLMLSVSCFGRRVAFGEGADQEIEILKSMLPDTASQVGFYSYGEISAFPDDPCDFHNMTLAVTILAEV